MREMDICNIINHNFDNEIPLGEIHSFMYFLKGCRVYERYVEYIDIDYLKKMTHSHDIINSYFNIIAVSFSWEETREGSYYWAIVNKLYQIIICYKIETNKLNFSGIINNVNVNTLYMSMFDDIEFLSKFCIVEDKHIKRFIECLYDYVINNNYITIDDIL